MRAIACESDGAKAPPGGELVLHRGASLVRPQCPRHVNRFEARRASISILLQILEERALPNRCDIRKHLDRPTVARGIQGTRHLEPSRGRVTDLPCPLRTAHLAPVRGEHLWCTHIERAVSELMHEGLKPWPRAAEVLQVRLVIAIAQVARQCRSTPAAERTTDGAPLSFTATTAVTSRPF